MEMAKSIREIAEYVSSLEEATVPDIEKLDELLQETMQVREEGDQERERLEVVAREKKGLEQQLDQAERKKQVTEEGRERCKERLERANRVLQEYKSEDAKVAELAAANPRLVQATKLLYTISRLTLDTKTQEGKEVLEKLKSKKGGLYLFRSPKFVSAEHGDKPRERYPSDKWTESGVSNVETMSAPSTSARRSVPSKSACSIDMTPPSAKRCSGRL